MSEVTPSALISQHYLNKRAPEPFCPTKKKKASDSKIQGVVRTCMTERSVPSGLFVSATAPEVVLGQVPGIDRHGKGKKRRPWNKKRLDG